MKRQILPLFAAVLLFACGSPSRDNSSGGESSHQRTEASEFAVENIRVEKEHKNAWVLKGMVRNNTGHDAKIAVDIKFLNDRGDILHTNKATVNGFDATANGQAAPFDYATDPKNFEGVTKYDVRPYER